MFEYHGWAVISETAAADDDDDGAFEREDVLVDAVRRRVEEIGSRFLLDVRSMNGLPCVHMAGHPNHRARHAEAVMELFAWIGELAPGSYGLLYVIDDEDPVHNNEFRVFRLVRGRVTEHADPFLSPRIPTLEDPYQPDD